MPADEDSASCLSCCVIHIPSSLGPVPSVIESLMSAGPTEGPEAHGPLQVLLGEAAHLGRSHSLDPLSPPGLSEEATGPPAAPGNLPLLWSPLSLPGVAAYQLRHLPLKDHSISKSVLSTYYVQTAKPPTRSRTLAALLLSGRGRNVFRVGS